MGFGPLIGGVCGDVVGFADRTPSSRRAGGIVVHLQALLRRRLLTWPRVRPGRCSPERVSAAVAMVSPVTVVSERVSQCPVWPEPIVLMTGLSQAKLLWGGAGQGSRCAGISPARDERCHSPLLPRPAVPHLRARPQPPARLREGGKHWARDSEA